MKRFIHPSTIAFMEMVERIGRLNVMKVQKIGPYYLCSYYLSPDNWDITIETVDPRAGRLFIRGSL